MWITTHECENCDFKGRTVNIMEDHILSEHTVVDSDNKFPCDECTARCETKDEIKNHYIKNHKDNTKTEEETILKEELRQLKNNFERLESLF